MRSQNGASDTNITEETDLCYKYILVAPYKIETSLREYQFSGNNTHYQSIQSYQGESYNGGYKPFFPLYPTFYFVNNADSYNATTANYNPVKYSYFAPTITYNKTIHHPPHGPGGGSTTTQTVVLSKYSKNSNFYFGIEMNKKEQTQSTTSIRITFPQKTTVNQNRHTINNS